jgi:hypothetical protein
MHNGTLKHHNYNTKIFVDEVENLLNQLKGKTSLGQPNFGKHYMKIQITDSRKYSQPLKISVLCKNNKLLACFLTDHLYSLHLHRPFGRFIHVLSMRIVVLRNEDQKPQEKGQIEAFTTFSLAKPTHETHSSEKTFETT